MSKHIYGPVPSRRLGLSLGVDLVPYKICSYDCIYCQIGVTQKTTIERKPYIQADEICSQLEQRLNSGLQIDHITLAGSGEPTLNSQIGSIIQRIKSITHIPVAVLTNGSLLNQPDVRKDIRLADVVMPSLDAFDQTTFKKMNRPDQHITFHDMINGLIEFRSEYNGLIWLEIFIIEAINASLRDADEFNHWVKKINPDRIDINTAVRPPAEPDVFPVSREVLMQFCQRLGSRAKIIADFKDEKKHAKMTDLEEGILNMLERRPCSLQDICSVLSSECPKIKAALDTLVSQKKVEPQPRGDQIYYSYTAHNQHN